MMSETKHDRQRISISGITRLDSVDAQSFNGSGSTTVEGDVEADWVDLSGSATIGGDLVTETADLSGAVSVAGDLSADVVDSSGTAKVTGESTVTTLVGSGSFSSRGPARIDRVDCSGSTKFASLEAKSVTTSGAFTVTEAVMDEFDGSGNLDVDTLETGRFSFRFATADARVRRLEAETVDVQRVDQGGVMRLLRHINSTGSFTIDTLVADSVELEYTNVGEVTADSVELGPGCEVDLLRARAWNVHADATVHETEYVE